MKCEEIYLENLKHSKIWSWDSYANKLGIMKKKEVCQMLCKRLETFFLKQRENAYKF